LKKGLVYIVGAGPGDTGLFTLRGRQCLEEAEVVVYDYHVNAQILGFAHRDAELIYAGKRGGHHTLSQDRINEVLVEQARQGKIVCRLKGGDPFIFGRGGEEAEDLAAAGIPFEIIPGISSAIAAPAYAGIPLTHRKFATTVAFIPGHEDREKKGSSIAWDKIVGVATLVFLMGVKNLPYIAEQLMKHGRSPETAVGIIRWGTRAEQSSLISTLGGVAELVRERNIRPPAVMVVGDVVNLRARLQWFETKPMFGHRILATREQTLDFRPLKELGAEILSFPTIEQLDPESWEDADRAIDEVESYDWLVFTSVNAVAYFFRRFLERGRDIRDLKGVKICTIGPKTRDSVEKYGIRVDLVPGAFRAEGLVDTFGDVKGRKFLLPRALEAREIFPDAVRAGGGEITVATVYRTVCPERRGKQLRRFLKEGRITVATFTSASTFNNLITMLEEDAGDLLRNVAIAAIGPVTGEAIERAGLKVRIMPEKATVSAMVEEIGKWAATSEGQSWPEREIQK
jgi:uroporphyrinogen III methyltransferase/synthase